MELTPSEVYVIRNKILRIKHYFILLNNAFPSKFEKKKKIAI